MVLSILRQAMIREKMNSKRTGQTIAIVMSVMLAVIRTATLMQVLEKGRRLIRWSGLLSTADTG